MNELEKLEHRINLITPKLENIKTGNIHKKNTYIYMMYLSLKALKEKRKPVVWVSLVDKETVADIDGLNKIIDDAEDYLASFVK